MKELRSGRLPLFFALMSALHRDFLKSKDYQKMGRRKRARVRYSSAKKAMRRKGIKHFGTFSPIRRFGV